MIDLRITLTIRLIDLILTPLFNETRIQVFIKKYQHLKL
ncbi:hypothetical protein L291_2275 [Acinetobacter guillouiae MSP4-18]|nr:hypothetical protein L291_2275 [Acinetobacter guillouiae MSP4-18]